MQEWLTTTDVRTWTKDLQNTPDAALQLAVDAASSYVVSVRPEYVSESGDTYHPAAEIKLGAIMLAARWFARRGTELGATSTGYGDFGTETILRHDPDVARMLLLGRFAPFGFGAPPAPVTETTGLL